MKNFDKLKSIFKGNTIALGVFDLSDSPDQSNPGVERDPSGIPVAWRIFKLGENPITRGGETFILDFTGEMFDQIIAYFAEKGAKIPLDSRHFLYYLAEELNVSESDVLRLLPDGNGTFGFGSLEKRPDGLWVTNVEYVPLARQLIAQKIFRYFSPVIRGLVDGHLRVTSVTFVNEPALNNLDAIAASAECNTGILPVSIFEIQGKLDALAASADIERNNKQKEKKMNKLFIVLAGLLGMDSISLGADGNASPDVVTKLENLKTELPGLKALKQKTGEFIAAVKDKLALGADADLNAVEGKVLLLVEKAGQADQLKVRVDALELAAETDKLEKIIEKGKAEGKIPESLIPWAKKQDSVALSAFLEVQPVVVPIGQVNREKLPGADSIALSAADKDVCEQLGLSEEKFLATKKAKK